MSLTILLIEGVSASGGVRVEIPAWGIDAVTLDDLGGAYAIVANRDPEPDETGIRVDTAITFDVLTDGGDSPSSADLVVTVDVDGAGPVTAYDGGAGGFQAGWDGPGSAVTFVDAYTMRIAIDRTVDFESEQVVAVSIAGDTTGAQAYNATYSFTIEDTLELALVSALAIAKQTVEVTFDDTYDSASALVAGNYVFTRLTASDDSSIEIPSVPIAAVSVEAVTPTTVRVTLDWEMTPGVTYTLTVSSVADESGNVIAAPNDTADFVGYVSTSVPADREFDLYRMLPQKARDDDASIRDLFRFIGVAQEITDLLLCGIDEWTHIVDPDIAPESFVDAILCDLGNPFEFDLTLTEKRKLALLLVPLYQQKGTGVGIINAVRFFLGIEVTINALISEGWILGDDELGDLANEGTAILGPGTAFDKYSFEIISPINLTDEQREQIESIAIYMKPAHTHFVRFVEPAIPVVFDHVELGESELGFDGTWDLH